MSVLYGLPKRSKALIPVHRYFFLSVDRYKIVGGPRKIIDAPIKNTGPPAILSVHRPFYRSTNKFNRCTDNIIDPSINFIGPPVNYRITVNEKAVDRANTAVDCVGRHFRMYGN